MLPAILSVQSVEAAGVKTDPLYCRIKTRLLCQHGMVEQDETFRTNHDTPFYVVTGDAILLTLTIKKHAFRYAAAALLLSLPVPSLSPSIS